jgi:hypothetical protein
MKVTRQGKVESLSITQTIANQNKKSISKSFWKKDHLNIIKFQVQLKVMKKSLEEWLMTKMILIAHFSTRFKIRDRYWIASPKVRKKIFIRKFFFLKSRYNKRYKIVSKVQTISVVFLFFLNSLKTNLLEVKKKMFTKWLTEMRHRQCRR